jgi:ATP-dependent helicase HrpB
LIALPIDEYLGQIDAALEKHRAVVVVAEPGTGKSTRIPPHLVASGAVLLLQPRRAAARAIAARIASEHHWTIGREVGWQVRLDRRYGPDTQLLVATEGILTARLQQDPLLSDFRTVILDEFHERSIDSDLGLALTKQAWRARDDLRIVVMSATLNAQAVSRFLDDCPVLTVTGAIHPLAISYAPGQSLSEVAANLAAQVEGDVLCFLPGVREINTAVAELRAKVGSQISVWPLYGSMDASAQDAVLSDRFRTPKNPASDRRIIVATNIAETSLTVPGVRAVVDRGLQKVSRYDAARAIDSLELERITKDAADQRAGRAARIGSGRVVRLWDERDRLAPHREAEIHRIDLAAAVLAIAAWGGAAETFEWFESPREEAIHRATVFLQQLGAIRDGAITDVGRMMGRLPVHPRLAAMLIAGDGDRRVARACAILSERPPLSDRHGSTSSDILTALDRWSEMPSHVQITADDLWRSCDRLTPRSPRAPISDDQLLRAVLAGYPDRVAQRRQPHAPRVKLASGAGAVVMAPSGVRDAPYLVALDVRASTREDEPDSVIRMASAIERHWLQPTTRERRHWIDEGGTVRAARVECYGALVLAEHPTAVDPDEAQGLLVEAWFGNERSDAEAQLLRRLAFAGIDVDLRELATAAAFGIRSLSELDLTKAFSHSIRTTLEREAPATLLVPSGRTVVLEYIADGGVSASVKLQELFGLAETPCIGSRRVPVLLHLLAPNGRPVQTTRDVRSFWDRTYPEVRKELRGRYPKHPWPEDPWTALPTSRTNRHTPHRR